MPRPVASAAGISAAGRVPGLYRWLETEMRRRHAEHETMNAYVEAAIGGPWSNPHTAMLDDFDARRPVAVSVGLLIGHQARAAGIRVPTPSRADRARSRRVTATDRVEVL